MHHWDLKQIFIQKIKQNSWSSKLNHAQHNLLCIVLCFILYLFRIWGENFELNIYVYPEDYFSIY